VDITVAISSKYSEQSVPLIVACKNDIFGHGHLHNKGTHPHCLHSTPMYNNPQEAAATLALSHI
jgi:hypothetical protein